MKLNNDFVGVIPAAGYGTRLKLKSKSKEILPLNYPLNSINQNRKVISSFLIDQLRTAGIEQNFMVIRSGKWDIPKYYAQEIKDLILSFIVIKSSNSVSSTIDFSYPFIKNKFVILSFPDLIIYPQNAVAKCKSLMISKKPDILLGLFKVNNPSKFDMVDFDNKKRLKDISIKSNSSKLKYAWTIAIWNPKFTEYLHLYLQKNTSANSYNLQLSEIIISAIKDGFNVALKLFYNGKCLDIGTKEDYNIANQFIANSLKEI